MTVQEILNMIVNQGFAVAVAIYSLTRLEKTMKDNTAVLSQLVVKLGEKEDEK